MATTTNPVTILQAIKARLVELNFWGDRIEFGEDEDAVPSFPMVLPCAMVHPVSIEYQDKTGEQSWMTMTVGITVLADMIERDWTLVGPITGGLDLAEMLYQVREKFKRSTLGDIVHLVNVTSQGKPSRAVYDDGNTSQSVFRVTSTLQIINYQAG